MATTYKKASKGEVNFIKTLLTCNPTADYVYEPTHESLSTYIQGNGKYCPVCLRSYYDCANHTVAMKLSRYYLNPVLDAKFIKLMKTLKLCMSFKSVNNIAQLSGCGKSVETGECKCGGSTTENFILESLDKTNKHVKCILFSKDHKEMIPGNVLFEFLTANTPGYAWTDYFINKIYITPITMRQPTRITNSITKHLHTAYYENLQSAVTSVLRNKIPETSTINHANHTILIALHNLILGNPMSAQSQSQPSLWNDMTGKLGMIRSYLVAKQTASCGRAVVTSHNGDMGEFLIPQMFCNIGMWESVTSYSLSYAEELAKLGAIMYYEDSAGKIYKWTSGTSVRIGTRICRKIVTGDTAVLNRQPSLHKFSMMSHILRVSPTPTAACGLPSHSTVPYNADFDGDQMNIHVPTTIDAQVETMTVLSAVNMIMSGSVPMIKPVFHELTVLYAMSSRLNDRVNITMFSYVNARDYSERADSINRRMERHGFQLDTNRYVLSLLYPSTLCLNTFPVFTYDMYVKQIAKLLKHTPEQMAEAREPFMSGSTDYFLTRNGVDMILDHYKNSDLAVKKRLYEFVDDFDGIEIENGVHISGRISADNVGILTHRIQQHGNKRAAMFLSDCTRVASAVMETGAFSMCYKDLSYASREDSQKIRAETIKFATIARSLLREYQNATSEFERAQIESRLESASQTPLAAASKTVVMGNDTLSMMISSGARGSKTSALQMKTTCGQQFANTSRVNIRGLSTLNNPTSTHTDPIENGIVPHGYVSGQTPDEIVAAAIPVRSTIAASKQTVTVAGDIANSMAATMGSLHTCPDFTIRQDDVIYSLTSCGFLAPEEQIKCVHGDANTFADFDGLITELNNTHSI